MYIPKPVLAICTVGILAGGYLAWRGEPLRVPARFQSMALPTLTAKAVITDTDGKTPATVVALNGLLVLSAEESVVGDLPTSILWDVRPRALDAKALRFGKRIAIATGAESGDLEVRLYVAKNDTVAAASFTARVGNGAASPCPPPTPTPTPNPTPAPEPVPTPAPAPAVIAPIRDAAQAYFGYEIKTYRDGAASTRGGTPYNDIVGKSAAEHAVLKETLAKLIDAELHPLVDTTTGDWKDKAAGAKAWGLIAESLRAGMRLASQ